MKKREPQAIYLRGDNLELVKKLDAAGKAELWDVLISYWETGETPDMTLGVDIIFTTIRQNIEKDRARYHEKCVRNSRNAKKRWGDNAPEESSDASDDSESKDARNDAAETECMPADANESENIRPSASECDRMPTDATACDSMPSDTSECDRMPSDATVYDRMPSDASECDRMRLMPIQHNPTQHNATQLNATQHNTTGGSPLTPLAADAAERAGVPAHAVQQDETDPPEAPAASAGDGEVGKATESVGNEPRKKRSSKSTRALPI